MREYFLRIFVLQYPRISFSFNLIDFAKIYYNRPGND